MGDVVIVQIFSLKTLDSKGSVESLLNEEEWRLNLNVHNSFVVSAYIQTQKSRKPTSSKA